MDTQTYENYKRALISGILSFNGLSRIIRHDRTSEWQNNPDGLARLQVYKECQCGQIQYKKLDCEPGDETYGHNWPLPLSFGLEWSCHNH